MTGGAKDALQIRSAAATVDPELVSQRQALSRRDLAVRGSALALCAAVANPSVVAATQVEACDAQTALESEENAAAIAGAMKVLDDWMTAFNARDLSALEGAVNFPSVRLASNTMVIVKPGDFKPAFFTSGALAEWHHSVWGRRKIIHAGPDKVHIDTCFIRYRADGSVISSFDSIYVVTLENGRWGIKARSSYAP